MSHNYAVIMAGGAGTRFWPTSTTQHPKQFLDILGTGESLLQQTYRRMAMVVPEDHIYIVTSDQYKELCAEQLPQMNREHIIGEPARRNTAPCIAYAAFKLKKRDPLANFVVTPADHLVTNETSFVETMQTGLAATADRNILLTIGMTPTRPETGYGYIQHDQDSEWNDRIKLVKTFTEKPNMELAETFIKTGEFLWNAGIFIWNANAILSAFDRDMTELYSLLNSGWDDLNSDREAAFIEDIYGRLPNESIDYGILEKASAVYVMPAEFGWSDLGSWVEVHEKRQGDEHGNTGVGHNVLMYQAKNNTINLEPNIAAVISGLEDYVVIQSEDRLLICPRSEAQAIKRFVGDVKLKIGEHYV